MSHLSHLSHLSQLAPPRIALAAALWFCASPYALGQSRGDDAPDARAVERAIDFGVEHLRERYADGMGRDAQFGAPRASLVDHPGLRALTVYALLRSGVASDDPVVEALLARLALERCTKTYDSACLLLALSAYDPIGERAWIRELAEDLVAWQEPAGDWGYPEGGDLSNTQYAALALHAAADAGVAVPIETWSRLADVLPRYRTKSGGFAYIPRGRRPTGSMTTAAIGTLALCELELAAADALDIEQAHALRAGRDAGLRWLAKHFEADHNPGLGSWTHYYLYGLERVGAFAGVERIGPHDWYAEGARWLVETQDGGGTWPGTFERLPTLFALLFLRRATRPRAPETPRAGGEPVPERPGRPAGQGATSERMPDELRLRVESLEPLTLALSGWDAAQRAGLNWPDGGARVLRVVYEADGAPFAAVLGDGLTPSNGRPFRVATRRLAPGDHALRARVTLALPEAEDADTPRSAELLSEEVRCTIAAAHAEPPVSAELGSREPNLMPLGRPRAEATSTLEEGRDWCSVGVEPARSVDDNPRSPWLADGADEEPTLDLRLRRPQRADRIAIHAARLVPRGPGEIAHGVRVGVRVNGGAEHLLTLSPAGHGAAELVLEEATRVRTLELRLLRAPEEEAPSEGVLGLGEIQLFLTAQD